MIQNAAFEPLIYGHAADACGLAWHPLQHHHFATAADSCHVFYWNSDLRQLIAKCSLGIGVAARSVCFSPRGEHIAVGCADGSLRVISMECGAKPPLSEEVPSPSSSVLHRYPRCQNMVHTPNSSNFHTSTGEVDSLQGAGICALIIACDAQQSQCHVCLLTIVL
jgi:WD40 repeat protein